MKELKRAEMIWSENFDINIKPYITIAEMELIVTRIISIENVVQRRLLKDVLVLELCTDIENTTDLDYDLAVESGLMNEVITNISNYYEIDEYVYNSEQIRQATIKFLQSISETAEKAVEHMPKTPKAWEKLIEKVGGIAKKNDK